ncbi:MAG: hypothetical protein JNK30_11445 [Phenylobacterium sp.]|uniref:hypothetical protein n=1 Tax=Phenylobacterium sp. TaxID=1871053 RepID=UPI001A39D1C4|nr:hypothetical protein [Phenylobacterium sp.]MBL8771986.1 hypothetical protein [Phenylobacterium sp.]
MTTAAETTGARPGWLFWLVVAVGLFWNGFGAVDYTMSHVQGEAWYRAMGMDDAMIAHMASYPTWMHAVWAIGVWGSFLGSVLLLLRSRWAFHAFAASTVGALGNFAYILANPGPMDAVMPLVIIVICAFFIWYAWTMTKRGVLR